jgi:hypothetical protein
VNVQCEPTILILSVLSLFYLPVLPNHHLACQLPTCISLREKVKSQESRVKSQESSKSQDDCPPGSCLATWSWLDGETASPVEIHPPRSWLPCSVSRCRGKYTQPHQKFEIRTTTSHTGSSSTCSNCPIQIWPRPRPNRTHVRYRN